MYPQLLHNFAFELTERNGMKEWLTLGEVAKELNISVRTMQHYSKQDPEFPPIYRFGHRNSRIEREAFETWKEAKRMK